MYIDYQYYTIINIIIINNLHVIINIKVSEEECISIAMK